MHTPSTSATAPQHALSFPFPSASDANAAAPAALRLPGSGAGEVHAALESGHENPALRTVFESREAERQRQPDQHRREVLAALLESRNLDLNGPMPRDGADVAGAANPPPATSLMEPQTARLGRTLTALRPGLPSGTLNAVSSPRSSSLEQTVHLALRPGAPAALVSAMETELPRLPADLQAAWLAEWMSWPQSPAGIEGKAMALIHSGQLSDAARTNLLAKLTVRNLFAPPASATAPLHRI